MLNNKMAAVRKQTRTFDAHVKQPILISTQAVGYKTLRTARAVMESMTFRSDRLLATSIYVGMLIETFHIAKQNERIKANPYIMWSIIL